MLLHKELGVMFSSMCSSYVFLSNVLKHVDIFKKIFIVWNFNHTHKPQLFCQTTSSSFCMQNCFSKQNKRSFLSSGIQIIILRRNSTQLCLRPNQIFILRKLCNLFELRGPCQVFKQKLINQISHPILYHKATDSSGKRNFQEL